MNIHNAIISPPLSVLEDNTIMLNDRSTFWVTPIVWTGSPLAEVEPLVPSSRNPRLPNLYIEESVKGIAAVGVEGTTLEVVVRTDVAPTVDAAIDWTIALENISPDEVFVDQHATFDTNYAHLNLVPDATVIPTLTGTASIVAGSHTGSILIPTVDDALFLGQGIYRVASIEITSSTDLVSENRSKSSILIQEAEVAPELEGFVTFGVKPHPIAPQEPLSDADGTGQQSADYGLDSDTGTSNLRTFIIDDTPLVSLHINQSEPLVAPNGEDVTNANLLLQYIIQNGQRS